jgi:RimJ/RimL family protein N-acetyltransferase
MEIQILSTTDRLLIEPLTIKDCSFILELVNTDGWLEFIGNRNINSEDEATAYIRKIIDNPNTIYWVVKLKDNDSPIGIITFIKRDYLAHYDIGCAFLSAFGNKGYAYEATKALLCNVIDSAEHSHILSITNPNNYSAIKLLKKLGLQFQEEIEVENEKLQLYAVSADKLYISEITRSFFGVFINKGHRQPNLDSLDQICIRQAMIINKKGSEANVYDLTSFIEPRKRILTDGTLTEFEEKETYEETRIINNIAHRYSEYEKSGILDGKAFTLKGFKFFQFIKTEQSWKISSVLWEDYEN